MTFRLRHLAAALLLHVALFGLLAGGAQCSSKIVRPPPIQGVLLDPSRAQTAAQKKHDAELREQQRQAAEAEKQRQQEEARKKNEAEKKQKELAEKKKAAEDLKLKQAADARKRKTEDLAKQKEAVNKKKTDELAKKKKQQGEERERQLTAQRELQDKAQLEDQVRQEAMRREADKEANARAASEREKKQAAWADLLSRAVERKWTRPSTVTKDFECTVHVLLLPDGTVSAANVVRSSGNASLDKSVEDAVYRASPLPKPADPSVFDRDLIFKFKPGNQ